MGRDCRVECPKRLLLRAAIVFPPSHGFPQQLRRVCEVQLLLDPPAVGLDGLHVQVEGRGDLARQAGSPPTPVDRRLEAQGLASRVRISPATVGPNHLSVELSDTGSSTVERVQLTLTYLDDDLGSEPLILQPSAGTTGTWEADSSALSQPGPWQADLLVRRQGQDDVRSTMRFSVVALPTGTAQSDSSATYPPVPSWLHTVLPVSCMQTLVVPVTVQSDSGCTIHIACALSQ